MGPSGHRWGSSSGYEDKRADWSNKEDGGNDCATDGDTTKTRTIFRGQGKKRKLRRKRKRKRKRKKEKGKRKKEKGKRKKEKGRGRDVPREKFINITEKDLWALQRVLDSRKSSELHVQEEFGKEQQSVRFKSENCGGNGRSGRSVQDVERTRGTLWRRSPLKATCCLPQKRTQLTRWRRPSSTRTPLWKCWKIVAKGWMAPSFREFSNCRALHAAAWVDVQEASQRHSELKRKQKDAHERTFHHGESLLRTTKDHVKAEEVLNNSLGCLGVLVKDTAGNIHALTCGVPDRVSNETKS